MATGTKIQTLTIVAGTMVCNAKCPDCVSQMTTGENFKKYLGFPGVEWENLGIAANIAIAGGATTVLFTGKGEPTVFPEQIYQYLLFFQDEKYDQLAIMEIQTNGLLFQEDDFLKKDGWLQKWYKSGLRVISLSIVDVVDEENRAFLTPDRPVYPSLKKTIEILHGFGFTVRLNLTMTRKNIHTIDGIDRVVDFCLENQVEQLSIRPVRRPYLLNSDSEQAKNVYAWVGENQLNTDNEKAISDFFASDRRVRLLRNLVHGARVFDYRGQNLCLTDCLTGTQDEGDVEEVRQLIFYSGGMISYDWSSLAANIIGWGPDARKFVESLGASEGIL